MRFILPVLALLASRVLAQHGTVISKEGDETLTSPENGLPTGTDLYHSVSSTITFTTTTGTGTEAATSTGTQTGNSTKTVTNGKDSVTLLVGGKGTTTLSGNGTQATGNATATSTSTSAVPTNTRPCNGYPQFCQRSYSNITQVAAHNSPFVRTGNAASNQFLPVKTQLNDGVRMRKLTHRILRLEHC